MSMKKITNFNSLRDVAFKDYMHGDDLKGKEVVLTIEGFYSDMFYKRSVGKKVEMGIVKFVEPNWKPILLTNKKVNELVNIFKNFKYEPEKIIGQKVTVFAVEEKHIGEVFNVLHFKKATAPVKKSKPSLEKGSEKWSDAVKSLNGKTVTIDQIKGFYTLTKKAEAELIEEAKNYKPETETK